MASSSSVSVPPLMKDEEPRNWAELPQKLTSSILLRLGAVEILLIARQVCRSWRRVCKDPSMWLKINMCSERRFSDCKFDSLCRRAVDLSQGGLLEIDISDFCSDELLTYIAHRSSNLRSLALQMSYVTNKGLVNAIAELPLLETLEVSHTGKRLNLKAIGQACPQLQTFKLGISGYWPCRLKFFDNDDALAIAESMPQLRHLQLIGNRLTDIGLNAILDHLPHLKHLDLRRCFNIDLVGNLEKRCLERITEVILPDDTSHSTDGSGFGLMFFGSDTDDTYSYLDDSEDEYDF